MKPENQRYHTVGDNNFSVRCTTEPEEVSRKMVSTSNQKVAAYFTSSPRHRSFGTLGLLLFAICCCVIYFIYTIQPTDILDLQKRKLQYVILDITSEKLFLKGETVEESTHLLKNAQNPKGNESSSIDMKRLLSDAYGEKNHQTPLTEKVPLCKQDSKQEKHKNDQVTQLLKEKKEVLEANFNYMTDTLGKIPYPGVDNYTRYTVARLGMHSLSSVETLKPEFGPVINDHLSFRYRFNIPPCAYVTANRSVFIAVMSAPYNFNKRYMIRKTWLNHLKALKLEDLMGLAGFAFILGMTENNMTQQVIDEENEIFGDLIQIEISDFYRNLSLKVAGLLNWVYRNCASVDFVMKLDDDVYVNVRNLAHFVQSYHPSNRSIFGTSAGPFIPNRAGKWAITFEEWPWSQYPQYFMGPAILMPQSTILPLLAASQTIPMMPFDDLYLTGMCAEKAGLKLSFSTSSFGVLGKTMPVACEIRRLIAWLTGNQNISHVATTDFYNNTTRKCIATDSEGVNVIIDHNEPVHFLFN